MTSVEKRLQNTEAALYVALNALHERDGGIGSISLPADGNTLTTSTPQRSKTEKQHEWKRLQLQTGEDLVAWFLEKQQQTTIAHDLQQDIDAPVEHIGTDQLSSLEPLEIDPGALDFSTHALPSSTPSVDAMERLKSCRCPTVPNGSLSPTTSTTWLRNYF
jgi:hypothetical protein